MVKINKSSNFFSFRWGRAIDREKVVYELKESGFDVVVREYPSDEWSIDLYKDEKYEIIVKSDTVTARLSAFKAVLSRAQAVPLTKKDLRLREMILKFYPKKTLTPFPLGLGIEQSLEDDFLENEDKQESYEV
jgi:hypothetical protein